MGGGGGQKRTEFERSEGYSPPPAQFIYKGGGGDFKLYPGGIQRPPGHPWDPWRVLTWHHQRDQKNVSMWYQWKYPKYQA
jgi:hypothetical protein